MVEYVSRSHIVIEHEMHILWKYYFPLYAYLTLMPDLPANLQRWPPPGAKVIFRRFNPLQREVRDLRCTKPITH
jgi:hypothetical protein